MSTDAVLSQSVREVVTAARAKQEAMRRARTRPQKRAAAEAALREREAEVQEYLAEYMALSKIVSTWRRQLRCAGAACASLRLHSSLRPEQRVMGSGAAR